MIVRPKPHPPIHVGAAFPYGARRAIRYGDGWIPTARGDIVEVLPKFREMVKETGRDSASIEITLFGTEMREGDGAAVEDDPTIAIEADTDAEFLLFDLG
jgi:alkanesulfonate monooxygenase SsuD/methylene tetrahydromethanopterin reductase-like flavin-dependent oxidoreductase (luciferase family)